MFRSAPNPFEESIVKATDESLTSEPWDIVLAVSDRVAEAGEQGARQAIAALSKRLVNRNANVQLYALSLAQSLSGNVGLNVQRELAGKSFTDLLIRTAEDRNTNSTVRNRVLELVKEWKNEYRSNPDLDLMEAAFVRLRDKNLEYTKPADSVPDPDMSQARREEEELQRVLELSKMDIKQPEASSSFVPSQPVPQMNQEQNYPPQVNTPQEISQKTKYTPVPLPQAPPIHNQQYQTHQPYQPQPSQVSSPPLPSPSQPIHPPPSQPFKVRAIFDFKPEEANELQIQTGDVIDILESSDPHWYYGRRSDGQTGVFPRTYVESFAPLEIVDQGIGKRSATSTNNFSVSQPIQERNPELDAENELLSQAADVSRLVDLLRSVSPGHGIEDPSIQLLYSKVIAMRPHLANLLEKYMRRTAQLRSLSEGVSEAHRLYLGGSDSNYATNHHSQSYQQYSPSIAVQSNDPTYNPQQSLTPAQTTPGFNLSEQNLITHSAVASSSSLTEAQSREAWAQYAQKDPAGYKAYMEQMGPEYSAFYNNPLFSSHSLASPVAEPYGAQNSVTLPFSNQLPVRSNSLSASASIPPSGYPSHQVASSRSISHSDASTQDQPAVNYGWRQNLDQPATNNVVLQSNQLDTSFSTQSYTTGNSFPKAPSPNPWNAQ